MFFGKSKKRKSYIVGTPEYDQYEESDNTQDMLDLQERMRKHGFKGGPGFNKDRWVYGDDIFDIDRPAGGAAQIWTMKEADYNKLKDLLDKLDTDNDGDVDKTDVGNIAKSIAAYDVGRIGND